MLCDTYKKAEQTQLTWILAQDGERKGSAVNDFEKGFIIGVWMAEALATSTKSDVNHTLWPSRSPDQTIEQFRDFVLIC